MRLIDADAMIAALEVDPVECPGCPEPEFLHEFVALIENAPTVEAVEVVRCKDCKYYYYADNRIPSERGWACANDGCHVLQNDYCSMGERKEGDQHEG